MRDALVVILAVVMLGCGDDQSSPVQDVGPEPTCNDGKMNGSETDVDCGGDCNQCLFGKQCLDNSDCEQGYSCTERIDEFTRHVNLCIPSHCDNWFFDNQWTLPEGPEGDVDCGYVCIRPCEHGQRCITDSDCAEGLRCAQPLGQCADR